MKLATWNVNSLNVRLPHVLSWLHQQQPDVLCLQETKLEDKQFPSDVIRDAGYIAAFSGQKTYNGVAILSRTEGADCVRALPNFIDEQKRIIALTFGEVRVVSVYVPNGQSIESDKYQYKLAWLNAFTDWLRSEAQRHAKLAVLGDLNIAPADADVHDPKAWEGQVLCSEQERKAFRDLLALGFKDSFRLFEQPAASFSWWDYRMMAFRRNMGLRIDHILLSDALVGACQSCIIDRAPRKLERPSDHAPVMVEMV
jgi:exodeoxyribonuclease-3